MRSSTIRSATIIGVLVGVLLASCGSSDGGRAGPSSSDSLGATAPSRQVEVAYSFGPPKHPFVLDQVIDGWLVHGTGEYTGDWTATSDYASVSRNEGSGSAGLSLGVLVGEVAGCGVGGFVFVDAFRAGTPSGGWLIVPGFGTGALATLDGSGGWETTEGSLETESRGAIRGLVACGGSEASAPETGPFFGTRGPGSVRVDARSASTAPTIAWTQSLTPPTGVAAEPIVLSDGTRTLHLDGTWTGEATAQLASASRPVAGGGSVEGLVMRFDGTVEGCGAGSLLVVVLDRVDARGAPAVRTWEIVPDLGTGDLVGATGFGVGTGGATDGVVTLTGSMSCHA